MQRTRTGLAALLGIVLLGGSALAAEQTLDLKSAGALAFGPEGVLFIGDTDGAALYAFETGDRGPRAGDPSSVNITEIDSQIADVLGTEPQQISINDVAVNPASGRIYLSVTRGRGADSKPVLVRVGSEGKLETVALEGVKFSKVALPSPPAPGGEARPNRPTARQQVITDIAFVDGRVFVAGLSNEEFASRLLAIPYPFEAAPKDGTSIEIFHGAHGRFETASPVRTFAPFEVDGKPHLLAAYTCTPLVKIPVADLKPGTHVKGTTIAELGNRNRPLDMIVYEKGGKPYLLMANSSRGVMKIPTDGVASAKSIVEPVPTERQGIGYETIASLKGVEQLDRLDSGQAIILARAEDGKLNLQAIALP
jgi:hypothetical protein